MSHASVFFQTSTIARSSSSLYAEPVGLDGVQRMIAFVFGVSAFSNACADILKPASSVVSTKTGVAPHSFTCSG